MAVAPQLIDALLCAHIPAISAMEVAQLSHLKESSQ
jgi:hypothetical protein